LGLGAPYELTDSFNLFQARALRDFLLASNIVISSNLSYSPTSNVLNSESPSFVPVSALGKKVSGSSFQIRLNQYIRKLEQEQNRWQELQNSYSRLLPIDAVLFSNTLFQFFRVALLWRRYLELSWVDLELVQDLQSDLSASVRNALNSIPLISSPFTGERLEELKLLDVWNSCLDADFCRSGTANILYQTASRTLEILLGTGWLEIWRDWQDFTFNPTERITQKLQESSVATGHFLKPAN
jgi:hypothetical protein